MYVQDHVRAREGVGGRSHREYQQVGYTWVGEDKEDYDCLVGKVEMDAVRVSEGGGSVGFRWCE